MMASPKNADMTSVSVESYDSHSASFSKKTDKKRKKFHPLRAVRNIFRRKLKRHGSEELCQPSKKSSSSTEISETDGQRKRYPQHSPPYAVGLSLSHDSIFTPDHSNNTLETEECHPRQGFLASVNHIKLKDELLERIYIRRGSDDVGLPHSPCTSPTTAEILAQNLQSKSTSSHNTCSAGSLISMGSSENDEDSAFLLSSSHSSRRSLLDRRTTESDMDGDVTQPVPLNHQAARHKMAVRPKRTHGLPHHRKMQQLASGNLPSTPEVTEQPPAVQMVDVSAKPQKEVEKTTSSKALQSPGSPKVKNSNNFPPSEVTNTSMKFSRMSSDSDITMPAFREESDNSVCKEDTVSKTSCATPKDTKKSGAVSRSKSAAAELKIRHEIMQFNRRQQEKEICVKEIKSEEKSSKPVDKIDIKDSMMALEESASGKVYYKNKVNEKRTRKVNSSPGLIDSKDTVVSEAGEISPKNDKKSEESFFRRYLFGPRKSNRKAKKQFDTETPNTFNEEHEESNVTVCNELHDSNDDKVDKLNSTHEITSHYEANACSAPKDIKLSQCVNKTTENEFVQNTVQQNEVQKAFNSETHNTIYTPVEKTISPSEDKKISHCNESQVLKTTSTPKESHRISVIDRIRHLEQKTETSNFDESNSYKTDSEVLGDNKQSVLQNFSADLETAKTSFDKLEISPVPKSVRHVEETNLPDDSKRTEDYSETEFEDTIIGTNKTTVHKSNSDEDFIQNVNFNFGKQKQYSDMTTEKSDQRADVVEEKHINKEKTDKSLPNNASDVTDIANTKCELEDNHVLTEPLNDDKHDTINDDKDNSASVPEVVASFKPNSPTENSAKIKDQPELLRFFATRSVKQSTEESSGENKFPSTTSSLTVKQVCTNTQIEKIDINLKKEFQCDKQLSDKVDQPLHVMPAHMEQIVVDKQIIKNVDDQLVKKEISANFKTDLNTEESFIGANVSRKDDHQVVCKKNGTGDNLRTPLHDLSVKHEIKKDNSAKKVSTTDNLKSLVNQTPVVLHSSKPDDIKRSSVTDNVVCKQQNSLAPYTAKKDDKLIKKISIADNMKMYDQQNFKVKLGAKNEEQHHMKKNNIDNLSISSAQQNVEVSASGLKSEDQRDTKKTNGDNLKSPLEQPKLTQTPEKPEEQQTVFKKNISSDNLKISVVAQKKSEASIASKEVGKLAVKKSNIPDHLKISEQQNSAVTNTSKKTEEAPTKKNGISDNSKFTDDSLTILLTDKEEHIVHQVSDTTNKTSPVQRTVSEFSPTTIFSASSPTKDTQDSTPQWKQMAQQRREQREQKEKLQMAPTAPCVREVPVKPPKSSKVLDLVSNFQKLQAT